MIRALLIAAVLLIVGGTWTPVEGCACVAGGPPANLSPEARAAWERDSLRSRTAEQYDKAIAIFSGEVISGEIVEGGFARVRFRRDRAWKGTLPEEFMMLNGRTQLPDGSLGFSSCDFALPAGEKFLIFAYGDSIASMRAWDCTLSTKLRDAAATIEVLDALLKERASQTGKEETAILAVVDRFMTAISTNDFATLAELRAEGSVNVVERPQGGGTLVTRRPFKPDGTQRGNYKERYWDPVVHVRGSLAVVWTPYEFWRDGKTSHCGIDVFEMVKEQGAWRIGNMMWTVEPDACPALRPADALRVRPKG